jgi:hypothetical protein
VIVNPVKLIRLRAARRLVKHPLGVSVRCFQRGLTKAGRPILNVGAHPTGWRPRWNKRGKGESQCGFSLSASWLPWCELLCSTMPSLPQWPQISPLEANLFLSSDNTWLLQWVCWLPPTRLVFVECWLCADPALRHYIVSSSSSGDPTLLITPQLRGLL